MKEVYSDLNNGKIIISKTYSLTASQSDSNYAPVFETNDEEFTVSYTSLENVINFESFTYSATNVSDLKKLETTYRLSRDGKKWTDFLPLNSYINNFPKIDYKDYLYIDIKFKRKSQVESEKIRLLNYNLEGNLKRDVSDKSVKIKSGESKIIKPPFIYKVFSISDIEIITNSDLENVDIKYRYSQDNSRTWSQYQYLNKENITTQRINPIRFFQIEYLIENNSNKEIKISDINLIGDFQNVTADSEKTNLYGIRECCLTLFLSENGNRGYVNSDGVYISDVDNMLLAKECDKGNILQPLTDEEKSKLYRPYDIPQAAELWNRLSSNVNEMFGHEVEYYVTDPDENGIDYSINEYGLFNAVCYEKIKISVDKNQFPDNQIKTNQFDLMLFETFEVHIPKETFKTKFGVQRRPSKEDFMVFCQRNRMYKVQHAQQYRDFNNYAVYYKLILKKHNKTEHMDYEDRVKDRISELTDNNVIKNLFGEEKQEDKKEVANKKQLQPLTKDPTRISVDNSLIIKDLIENSTTIISKQYYDFSYALYDGKGFDSAGVTYKEVTDNLKKSDNRSFSLWFNINNYLDDEKYNFFYHYDDDTNKGIKATLENDIIKLTLNSDTFDFDLSTLVNEEVWYAFLFNLNQRNKVLEMYLYSRNVDIDEEDEAKFLESTKLKLIKSQTFEVTPQTFEIVNENAEIKVSDIKLTNIRYYKEVIDKKYHNSVLNEYIVPDDTKYLIFADNANKNLILPNYSLNTTAYDDE